MRSRDQGKGLERLGIALAIRVIPEPVLADCRRQAGNLMSEGKLVNRAAAAAIVLIWLVLAALGILLVARAMGG